MATALAPGRIAYAHDRPCGLADPWLVTRSGFYCHAMGVHSSESEPDAAAARSPRHPLLYHSMAIIDAP